MYNNKKPCKKKSQWNVKTAIHKRRNRGDFLNIRGPRYPIYETHLSVCIETEKLAVLLELPIPCTHLGIRGAARRTNRADEAQLLPPH